jgi:hypothetical protein
MNNSNKKNSDHIIIKKREGDQRKEPFNAEAEGYVFRGVRYIPLGVVNTDFSQALSANTIDFMRISDDLDGYAYLSSGQVYNGTTSSVTIYLKSQYVTFGTPSIVLPSGGSYSWQDMPVTGVQCSVNSNQVILTAVKYAAKDEYVFFFE